MNVTRSRVYPDMYIEAPQPAGNIYAELCNPGIVKIIVWENTLEYFPEGELELFYQKEGRRWIPLLPNGRLL